MRALVLCFLTLLLISASCEEVTKEDSTKTNEEINYEEGTLATVTTKFEDEGCEVLLQIEEGDQQVLLWPINLEDQFKKNGTKLLIEFQSSRIMQSDCQKGRPVVLEKVRILD